MEFLVIGYEGDDYSDNGYWGTMMARATSAN
jgi:hypothetical protein